MTEINTSRVRIGLRGSDSSTAPMNDAALHAGTHATTSARKRAVTRGPSSRVRCGAARMPTPIRGGCELPLGPQHGYTSTLTRRRGTRVARPLAGSSSTSLPVRDDHRRRRHGWGGHASAAPGYQASMPARISELERARRRGSCGISVAARNAARVAGGSSRARRRADYSSGRRECARFLRMEMLVKVRQFYGEVEERHPRMLGREPALRCIAVAARCHRVGPTNRCRPARRPARRERGRGGGGERSRIMNRPPQYAHTWRSRTKAIWVGETRCVAVRAGAAARESRGSIVCRDARAHPVLCQHTGTQDPRVRSTTRPLASRDR